MVALVQATAVAQQVHACLVFSTSCTPIPCLLLCTVAKRGQSSNTLNVVIETMEHSLTMVGGGGSMQAVYTELVCQRCQW